MNKSFTLLELLIVIAIIAVLSTVVIFALDPGEMMAKARDTKRLTDLTQLEKAIIVYLSEGIKTLPTTSTNSLGGNTNINGTGWLPIDFTSSTLGSSIPSLPIDPKNNSSYYYTFISDGTNFELDCVLESKTYRDKMTNDGGDRSDRYEVGSSLYYNLRDTGPAGGLIFYDKGSYSGSPSWRYLEAAPSDQANSVWGTYPLYVYGADGTAIGTGYQNTLVIIADDPLPNKAADRCADLSIVNNGITYDDWFLPSQDELNLMYTNLKVYGVGGFADSYYWSSSGLAYQGNNQARSQNFSNGTQYSSEKNTTRCVRAVRAF